MTDWLDDLHHQRDHRRADGLDRRLRWFDRCARTIHLDDRALINFGGNDYLALAGHPRLARAAGQAAERWGVGSGASRLITGSLTAHHDLEQRFAAFKHAQAALCLPTGYMANLAALTALAGPDDLICLDKLNHASIIDAARLSGAAVRIFPHRDAAKLDRLLTRAANAHGQPPRRRLIVSDSVFSMDGDCADLPALCDLRDRHRAILIIDEAHATGIFGPTAAGLAEHFGLSDRTDVTISTASKALGSLGGILTAKQLVIDTIVNHARPLIYTTAAPPTQAAAIAAALDVIRDEPDRRARLLERSRRLREMLAERHWSVPPTHGPVTPIVPLIIGDAAQTVALSDRLSDAGLFVPAVRPPTVAPGSSRLRITLRCDHTDDDLHQLVEALGAVTK